MSTDKLDMQSPDLVNENLEKLAALFPNCVTETAEGKAIDFDLLKQELSHKVVEGTKERYRLEWPGKREAIVTANLPTTKTLRPVREDSVDFDNTENMYIEGDNLEVLKLLQESYLGKIKMIYIDPPYNTGKDFVYRDNFTGHKEAELFESGQMDEGNQRLVQNLDTSGRFHSDWLSMMFPRLKLARNLMSEDGVIFISIDDNEVNNLRKICDEVFGDRNFVAMLSIIVKTEGRRYGFFAKTHEYVLVYSKDKTNLQLNKLEVVGKEFRYFDDNGGFDLKELRNQNTRAFNSKNRPNLRYPFYVDESSESEDGLMQLSVSKREGWAEVWPITVDDLESVWRWGKSKSKKHEKIEMAARMGSDGVIRIFQKYRSKSQAAKTVWMDKSFISIKGTKEVQNLFGFSAFDFPKPVSLVDRLIEIGTNENDIVLDFFSGSATTGHAIYSINSRTGSNRKFILVQLPEKIDQKHISYKRGYLTICEVARDRLRKAGSAVLPNGERVWGFKSLKLDSSNMQDVYYHPNQYKQTSLDLFADNIKQDRSGEDLLTQVMLDWGLKLTLKVEQSYISNKIVYKVADNSLYACFESDIDESFAIEVAKAHPLRIVFRDSGFKDDTSKSNVKQLLKQLSPETEMKVL